MLAEAQPLASISQASDPVNTRQLSAQVPPPGALLVAGDAGRAARHQVTTPAAPRTTRTQARRRRRRRRQRTRREQRSPDSADRRRSETGSTGAPAPVAGWWARARETVRGSCGRVRRRHAPPRGNGRAAELRGSPLVVVEN